MNKWIVEELSTKVNRLALLLRMDSSISSEIVNRVRESGFDLTKDKIDLLQYIGMMGSNTITGIKKRSKSHDDSYLSRMISELEEKGLLNKSIKISDKREKYIKLTSKGEELVHIITDYYSVDRIRSMRDIVNRLNKGEAKAVNKFLDYSIERFNRGY